MQKNTYSDYITDRQTERASQSAGSEVRKAMTFGEKKKTHVKL